jgi:uncharacterized protein (TIGR02246 family)
MGVNINVEDMLAIQQVIARYSHTFDAGDADGWANVFTKDAIWESYAADTTTLTNRLRGHDELREFAAMRFREKAPGLVYYHHQSGILFDELTADTAKTRVMVIITIHKSPDPPRIIFTGVYTDVWKKTNEGWLLVHRVLRP